MGQPHAPPRALQGWLAGIRAEERTFTFRQRSADEFADFFLHNYGLTERASAALDVAGRATFRSDVIALAAAASRLPAGGPVAIPASYLEAIALPA